MLTGAWTGVSAILAFVVSLAGLILTFVRGQKSDEALGLSKDADRKSTETQTNLDVQGKIIDRLQKEVEQYRQELNAKDIQLLQIREQTFNLRQELGEAQVGLHAAERIIKALETEIESLRALIKAHEDTIAMHSETILELRKLIHD